MPQRWCQGMTAEDWDAQASGAANMDQWWALSPAEEYGETQESWDDRYRPGGRRTPWEMRSAGRPAWLKIRDKALKLYLTPFQVWVGSELAPSNKDAMAVMCQTYRGFHVAGTGGEQAPPLGPCGLKGKYQKRRYICFLLKLGAFDGHTEPWMVIWMELEEASPTANGRSLQTVKHACVWDVTSKKPGVDREAIAMAKVAAWVRSYDWLCGSMPEWTRGIVQPRRKAELSGLGCLQCMQWVASMVQQGKGGACLGQLGFAATRQADLQLADEFHRRNNK